MPQHLRERLQVYPAANGLSGERVPQIVEAALRQPHIRDNSLVAVLYCRMGDTAAGFISEYQIKCIAPQRTGTEAILFLFVLYHLQQVNDALRRFECPGLIILCRPQTALSILAPLQESCASTLIVPFFRSTRDHLRPSSSDRRMPVLMAIYSRASEGVPLMRCRKSVIWSPSSG